MNEWTLTAHARTYITGRWRRGELGADTRTSYTYTLLGLAEVHGKRPLNKYGPNTIDRWLESIGHLAPATRRNYLSRVRDFSRWLIAQGHIRNDPTAHVPAIRQPRKIPVTFTDAEVRQLCAALPDDRAKVIVGLLYGLGARCCEVARLEVEDYDRTAAVVLLHGKGDHERIVALPDPMVGLLDRYLAGEQITHGRVLRSRNDPTQGLSAATISNYVRRWSWAAGVKRTAFDGRSAHALRRTALSELMESTGDVRIVQAVAGHANLATTARHYLRPVTPTIMQEAQRRRLAAVGSDPVPLPHLEVVPGGRYTKAA